MHWAMIMLSFSLMPATSVIAWSGLAASVKSCAMVM